jgi:ubiquinone/menaquinone biosynthesis C-methylase UbiE
LSSEAELGELRERSRSGWDRANYGLLAERLMPVARDLIDACAVSAGQDVLDVAAGNGNAAAVAAAEGAHVVASDFSPGQVERGRERTTAEGLDVEWVVADVEELPFDDGSFDCVVSVFGSMFGLRPDRVAQELFRVLRPGGTVGLANWGSGGFQNEFFETIRRYRPIMPDGVAPPLLWGQEDVVRDRLGELAGSIEFERPSLRWEFASIPEMGLFFRDAGPRDMEELPEEKVRQLLGELTELAERYNSADDGSLRIDAEYLRVVARKRG